MQQPSQQPKKLRCAIHSGVALPAEGHCHDAAMPADGQVHDFNLCILNNLQENVFGKWPALQPANGPLGPEDDKPVDRTWSLLTSARLEVCERPRPAF